MAQFNSLPKTPDSRLTLRMPQLLDVGPALLEGLGQAPLSLPGLERLLARGQWLPPRTGLPEVGSVAPAPLALLGEGQAPGQAFCLRCDPVHLQADQDRLLLWDAAALSLSQSEADALVDSFNRHFAEDGHALQALRPDAWYLRSPRSMRATTVPVTAVTGRNPFFFMPVGTDRVPLEQLINETQMLFHDHPVNQARQQRGALPVSGVWPWGGGSLPSTTPRAGIDRVFAEDGLHRGLGQFLDCPVAEPPETFADWARDAGRGHDLVVLLRGSGAARLADDPGWREALAGLERDWWGPLARALGRGRLPSLWLDFAALGRVAVGPWRMRRVWRRPRPLDTVLRLRRPGEPR